MFIEELKKYFLRNNSDLKSESLAQFYFLLEIEANLTQKDIILKEKKIKLSTKKRLLKLIKEKIRTKKPIQQIVKKTYFMNEIFEVDENVLIPRPETQLLVDRASEIISKNGSQTVLDLCCGSLIIGIMLKRRFKNIEVTGSDFSKKALKIGEKNVKRFGVNINIIQSDLFDNIDSKYDLIVSNPPYIPKNIEKKLLEKNVEKFEPHLALFTNDNLGLEFYERIICQANNYLNNRGYLAFEIGFDQAKLVRDILEANRFSNIEIFKDISGFDRSIIGQKK